MAEDIIWNLNSKENEDVFPHWPHRDQDSYKSFRFKKGMKVSKSDTYLTLKNLNKKK